MNPKCAGWSPDVKSRKGQSSRNQQSFPADLANCLFLLPGNIRRTTWNFVIVTYILLFLQCLKYKFLQSSSRREGTSCANCKTTATTLWRRFCHRHHQPHHHHHHCLHLHHHLNYDANISHIFVKFDTTLSFLNDVYKHININTSTSPFFILSFISYSKN